MSDFYKQLAPFYHLIYDDWEASIAAYAELFDSLIQAEWGPSARSVLDVSCGIGTQSIALATRGYQVTASDLSPEAVARAAAEARTRSLPISFSVCDMRAAYHHHGTGFDVVLSAGNSITHLLGDDQILVALREMLACLRPGGGCILGIRQYDQEPRGKSLFHPFRVHEDEEKRTIIFQVWDFEGDQYALSMYVVEEDRASDHATTHVMRSRYYAISPDHLLELVQEAGFVQVKRLDDGVIPGALVVGTAPWHNTVNPILTTTA
jgi:SAM-dependent methyltransferase